MPPRNLSFLRTVVPSKILGNRHLMLGLLALGACPAPAAEETDLPLGKVIEEVRCDHDPDNRYSLYLPAGYDANRSWPLILFFDPGARPTVPLQRFAEAANHFGFVMACSHHTKNYVSFEVNWGYALEMWKDVLAKVSVDPNRMYAGGFSGGARLASRVAMFTQKIQGVIACGAGFWSQTQKNLDIPFVVISTIGNKDMNYLELLNLERELSSMSVVNRRLEFKGGHQWPPNEICHEVLGWLQLQAFKKNMITKGEGLLDEQANQRLAAAKAVQEAGDILRAHRLYSDMLEDFGGLADLSSVEERLAKIEKKSDFKKLQKGYKSGVQTERATRTQIARKLFQGESLPSSEPLEFRKQMGWWKREVERLQKNYGKTENPEEQLAIYRIFDFLARVCFEKSIYGFREQDYQKVIFLNEVASLIIPKLPYAFFNLAKAYAQTGEHDKAFAALADFVKYGQPGPGKFTREPLLDPLKQDQRFQAYLQ